MPALIPYQGILGLITLCAVASTPISAETATKITATQASGLHQDLPALLSKAEYRRSKYSPELATNRISSVSAIIKAVRMHTGLSYVVLAKRDETNSGVNVHSIYVLEGLAGTISKPTQTTNLTPNKTAILLNLNDDSAQPLVKSLQGHLATLLPAVDTKSNVAVEDILKMLVQQKQIAFVILADRSSTTSIDNARVYVVPDTLNISIIDDVKTKPTLTIKSTRIRKVTPTADGGVVNEAISDDAVTVTVIPGKNGAPPQFMFTIDPDKFPEAEERIEAGTVSLPATGKYSDFQP